MATTVGCLLPWSNSAVIDVVIVSSFSQRPHRTTADRGRKVKNLDFTIEGKRATLAP
jgi:hypothetical protein